MCQEQWETRIRQHKVAVLVFVFTTLGFFALSVIIASMYGLELQSSATCNAALIKCEEESSG